MTAPADERIDRRRRDEPCGEYPVGRKNTLAAFEER